MLHDSFLFMLSSGIFIALSCFAVRRIVLTHTTTDKQPTISANIGFFRFSAEFGGSVAHKTLSLSWALLGHMRNGDAGLPCGKLWFRPDSHSAWEARGSISLLQKL